MNKFPPVAQRFFYQYSRMEYALKKQRMLNRDASANWNRFAQELGRAFFGDIVKCGAATYLIANPPRKQIIANGVIDWKETGAVSNTKTLFDAIRTARNNLFHGGKFPSGHLADSIRDERLLTECIAVLEIALQSHRHVAEHFHIDS